MNSAPPPGGGLSDTQCAPGIVCPLEIAIYKAILIFFGHLIDERFKLGQVCKRSKLICLLFKIFQIV